MANNPWRTFYHKEDHSVIYEVREEGDRYEIRLPGTTATDYLPKEFVEEIYEPAKLPEEG